jgi:hypothetical protein
VGGDGFKTRSGSARLDEPVTKEEEMPNEFLNTKEGDKPLGTPKEGHKPLGKPQKPLGRPKEGDKPLGTPKEVNKPLGKPKGGRK